MIPSLLLKHAYVVWYIRVVAYTCFSKNMYCMYMQCIYNAEVMDIGLKVLKVLKYRRQIT